MHVYRLCPGWRKGRGGEGQQGERREEEGGREMSDGPKREASWIRSLVSRISGSGGFVTFQGGRACVPGPELTLTHTGSDSPTFLVNGLWGEGMIALAYSWEIIVRAEKFFFLSFFFFLDRCSRVVDSDFVQSKDLNARRFFLVGIKSFNIYVY